MYSDEKPIEISKELEIINFRTLVLKYPQLHRKDDFVAEITNEERSKWVLKSNKVTPETKIAEKANVHKTQLESFQQAMKLLLIAGQWLGLNPVRGLLDTDVTKMRFTVRYWRFLFCMVIGIAQALATTLCLYRLLKGSIAIGALRYLFFYSSTCVTTFLFLQIAYKWPKIMKDVSKCSLSEYVDPRIKMKCYTATIVFIVLGLLEHLLSIIFKLENIFSCRRPNSNFYEEFLKTQFPWYFSLDVSKNIPVGILLQILNVISVVNWNYSDLCILCISMYLASILNQINEKVISASTKHYLPTSYWRNLREDYNRATRLVRSFDDVISGIVFSSLASNLFFICLQLYYILGYGVYSSQNKQYCENEENGPLGGHEYTKYLLFSVLYLLTRSLSVNLVAASVNTASLVPAPALYNVPSTAYCEEVARFITQVNEDKIALSGLQFFYVTKDLVLSVAGTIVTYELVLLQFSSSN